MISIESMATKYATQGGMSARSAQAMLSTALWSRHLREAQMGKRIEVKPGDRYGRLTVVEEVEQDGYLRRFVCLCKCGTTTTAVLQRLRNGTKHSCGCLHKESSAANGRANPAVTHSRSDQPIYNTWRGMLGRCKHRSNRFYHNYGGRGISVCDEWQDAATFIKWAFENGWKEGLQIDRVDNDGNYCPGNCRFVTRKQNCRNARHNIMITFGQTTQSLAAWAEQYGLHQKTLNNRIYRYGWTVEQALSLPLRQGKKP